MQVAQITLEEQLDLARQLQAKNAILLTEWVVLHAEKTHFIWYVLYWLENGDILCVQTILHSEQPTLIDLSEFFPVASRLQRSIYDLLKIPTKNAKDTRPWLIHEGTYTFEKVTGDGVHEIPVGPVHAGIIEPGHFRFSVVGEQILKLEERLGYAHKGVHHLLIGKNIQEGARLIGRISGDTTLAYAYAYALACENALSLPMDSITKIVRAIYLERERLMNHIGDIAALVGDAAFPTLQAQFLILKENLLRENVILTGHRYMMDAIHPGQSLTLHPSLSNLSDLADALIELQQLCEHHHGLEDRFKTTGILDYATAKKLGVIGVSAKASGLQRDLRRQLPDFLAVTEYAGDVAARVSLRFKECQQSIQLIQELLTLKDESALVNTQFYVPEGDFSIALVEAWRGPVCVIVSLNDRRINWCHFHDPSWQNWLALEYAVLGNIVADFPLINKSFNLSYSGQDS